MAKCRIYSNVIRTSQIHVAERGGRILGVLELLLTDQGFILDSVAVDPSAQSASVGRQPLELAEIEARRHGFQSIYLMTNEKMTKIKSSTRELPTFSSIG